MVALRKTKPVSISDLKKFATKRDVAVLETRLGRRIDDLGGRVATLEDKVDNLGGRVATLDAKVDNLGNRVATLEGKVDNLGSRVATLEAKVDDLGNRVTGLEGKVDDLCNRVGTLEGKIDDLCGRMIKVEAAVALLQADMVVVKDDLRSFHKEFDTFKDWTQTVLDKILKNTEDLKQEMTVLTNVRFRRMHERISRLEERAGLPPEEYF